MRRQAETERGTILVNHTTDKGLEYRIYKVLSKISKKTSNLN